MSPLELIVYSAFKFWLSFSTLAGVPFFSLTILKLLFASLTDVFKPVGVFRYSRLLQPFNIFSHFKSGPFVISVFKFHLLRSAFTIPDLKNRLPICVTFDTSHFDTSGFAAFAFANAFIIKSTFDVFQFDTLGFALFVLEKIPAMRVTLSVFSFSQPLICPGKYAKKFSLKAGKYIPSVWKLISFTSASFQIVPNALSLPPSSVIIARHIISSMCILPKVLTAEILTFLALSNFA